MIERVGEAVGTLLEVDLLQIAVAVAVPGLEALGDFVFRELAHKPSLFSRLPDTRLRSSSVPNE